MLREFFFLRSDDIIQIGFIAEIAGGITYSETERISLLLPPNNYWTQHPNIVSDLWSRICELSFFNIGTSEISKDIAIYTKKMN